MHGERAKGYTGQKGIGAYVPEERGFRCKGYGCNRAKGQGRVGRGSWELKLDYNVEL